MTMPKQDIVEKIKTLAEEYHCRYCGGIIRGLRCVGDIEGLVAELTSLIKKDRRRVFEEAKEKIESGFILLDVDHAGNRMKGEWVDKDELIEGLELLMTDKL